MLVVVRVSIYFKTTLFHTQDDAVVYSRAVSQLPPCVARGVLRPRPRRDRAPQAGCVRWAL